jgi:hypothetical protein
MCLGQVFNLGLSIAFVVPFGLPGVAAATLMGPLATDLCLLQPRLAKRTGVAMMTFYRHVVFPSALPVLVMVAFQQGLDQVWRLDRLWEVAVAEGFNVLVFWSAFWRLGASREERELVAARVKARLARASLP